MIGLLKFWNDIDGMNEAFAVKYGWHINRRHVMVDGQSVAQLQVNGMWMTEAGDLYEKFRLDGWR